MSTLLRVILSILLVSNIVLTQVGVSANTIYDQATVSKPLGYDDKANLVDNFDDTPILSSPFEGDSQFEFIPSNPDKLLSCSLNKLYFPAIPRAPPVEH